MRKTVTNRKELGEFLQNVAEQNDISLYIIERDTGLQGSQVKAVFDGSKNYAVETLFLVLDALEVKFRLDG